MRLAPMANTGHCPDPHHRDPAARSRTDVCSTLHAQCLTITPRKIGPDGIGNDAVQGSSGPSAVSLASTQTLNAPPMIQEARRALGRVRNRDRDTRGVWRPSASGSWEVFLVWVARLDCFPQGFKVWIAQPLIPLCSIMSPAHVRWLEEPYQADDAKRLAQDRQPLLAKLFERQCLGMHGDITAKRPSHGCATRTRRGAVWRVPRRGSRSPTVMRLSPQRGIPVLS
jgi:hypothetical protein